MYALKQIGDYHLNHCEDYFFTGKIGNDKILCAVMDGCTMGTDSYLASTLVGKLLRKIVKEKGYKELYHTEACSSLNDYLKSIMRDLFKELNIIKNQLMLEQRELLTTLIIMLIDTNTQKGIVLVVGDGLVHINGKTISFDQDNKPDYIGFHLSENFDTWYKGQLQKIAFESLKDISITTDGIFMFQSIKNDNSEMIDPIDFLVSDHTNMHNEEMLALKMKTLEHRFGLKPTDDLAIVRIIFSGDETTRSSV